MSQKIPPSKAAPGSPFGSFTRSVFARIFRLSTRPKPPASPRLQPGTIGDNGVVRVIAFSAGGADSVFQFGMVHAFLVSDAPKPHVVTGTSSGAVVAAMLADVLQAGESHGRVARRLAQVAQFRAFLDQIEQVPAELKEASLPDFTEVSARAGLKPLDLPTQQEEEKKERERTACARFGLTRLLNVLLSSRVMFRELTQIIRSILDYQASGEWRWEWGRRRLPDSVAGAIEWLAVRWLTGWTGFRIWLEVLTPALRDAPLLLRRGLSVAVEGMIAKGRGSVRELWEVSRLRNAKQILFESWFVQLGRVLVHLISYPVVALVWLLGPPAVVLLVVCKGAARRILEPKWRNRALRFTGILFLLAGVVLPVLEYREIVKTYTDLFRAATGLWVQHLVPGLYRWSGLREGLFRVFCGLLPLVAPGTVFAALLLVLSPGSNGGKLLPLFLAGFGIKEDLLTTGVLRKWLMRAFDPSFFGKRDFDRTLNEALGGPPQAVNEPDSSVRGSTAPDERAGDQTEGRVEGRRMLADWVWKGADEQGIRWPKDEPILVAPVAADLSTGRLITLEPETPTVTALAAACALPPYFAAVKLEVAPAAEGEGSKAWLVDGSCVAREPIQPVLELIKQLNVNGLRPEGPRDAPRPFAKLGLVADAKHVELCVISPFPTKRLREQERRQMAEDMDTTPKSPAAVTEPKARAREKLPGTLYRLGELLSLRATHAAKDERILVTLHSMMLKRYQEVTGKAFFCSCDEEKHKSGNWHVFANLRELEPRRSVNLVADLMRCADDREKRSLLLRTIAKGCRTSLEGLYGNKLAQLAAEAATPGRADPAEDSLKSSPDGKAVLISPCRRLQEVLKAERGIIDLPGIAEPGSPPGVTEICRECRFYGDPQKSWKAIAAAHAPRSKTGPPSVPDWGETGNDSCPLDIKAYLPKREPPRAEWPRDRNENNAAVPRRGAERPLVSVVFSGGVFRGVFQVGVLNALGLVGVKPDIVAGASVGTIVAALAARVFAEPDPTLKQHRIARVAATFLAVDRLVLTDRFADFVRRFTLRIGSAHFSPRDTDQLFRQFDRRDWELLTRGSRRVLAGIQRVTYAGPLELLSLLSLRSPENRGQLADRLLLCAQEALNRAGVGTELLGAEPLKQLIRAHVLPDLQDQGAEFNEFLGAGIHFLATTTNLTTGELDVLGSFCDTLRQPALVPGLLASSAFPGVFRPRMNWELRAGSPGMPEELIDGGLADNLPIIPVYRFVSYAGHKGWLKLRPTAGKTNEPCPHLLLTASLEPKKRVLEEEKLKQTAECWPWLTARTSQLQYNVKVDSHRRTQHELRKIYTALRQREAVEEGFPGSPEVEFPDLHVSCIKPEWLCGTFAFHPMLGFRRTRQAQNIAHGCASSLVHLYREQERHKAWAAHWWKHFSLHPGVCIEEKPPGNGREEDGDDYFRLVPRRPDAEGNCCFLQDRKCPFSKPELETVEAAVAARKTPDREPLGAETRMALEEIYRRCGKKATHQPAEQ